MNRRPKIVALGTALLLTASAAGAAIASDGHRHPGESLVSHGAAQPHGTVESDSARQPREAASLTGSAKIRRPTGEDMHFSFDAHLAAEDHDAPQRATGTFEFSHYLNGQGARAKAEVDCLITGGKVAMVSGVVTDTDLDQIRGHRIGITVHDAGTVDRLGYSWAVTEDMGPKDLPRCVSSAPFNRVEKGTGDFKVVPWKSPY